MYTPAEAYNGGGRHLLAWVRDDGSIRVSYNSGIDHEVLPGARTYASVAVVAFGDGFALFHTATDGAILWTPLTAGGWPFETSWRVVPNQRTSPANAVSVTSLGGTHLYMSYRGGDTGRIMGTYYNPSNSAWTVHTVIGGDSESYSSPAITYNEANNRLYVVHRGTNNRVYLSWQAYGTGVWSGWRDLGGDIRSGLSIAALANGHMMVAGTAPDDRVWYHRLTSDGYTLNNGNWEQESTNTRVIGQGPALVAGGAHEAIYLLAALYSYNYIAGQIAWKPAYRE
ncbi:hypothetical protein [Streptomyces sp. NBC_01217]|uniref:hypothetical protein n=1 Tax=Streptomyces sp. NBC_01217 TaxID=2903779 RepID=UPI002E0FB746|nr:hypothetical protein OG507_01430 [Streptomyces sp. NBC_01217]